MADPYVTLGVPPSSSPGAVKRAYHAACLRLHPDKTNGSDIAAFQALQDAWALLSDDAARRQHDDERERAAAGFEAECRMAEVVAFDEMRPDGMTGRRSWACRCGDAYELAEDELEGGSIVVPCDGCSLSIHVVKR